ncbi:Uncharacterised protein [Salmonella enterica subsp. enterica serovar Typhimurium str. DT104]|nr:Uncharacterised protein [Salmonella enterica subsp. enterica serovar Typhimurium str. DT104]CQN00772.1 Uncharacterised protein [Salmonella enterica subsp. enterica serovar Typhimurium str. DT104]CQQ51682.1 Uncharacterised protein [Salmonella enterica subsp. enterica serovar Typhimurium str. DT104]CQQ73211.1 Uncharacterised protein [Salmonella enterica subsp. enterica serovar Typhimurium str. DT104]
MVFHQLRGGLPAIQRIGVSHFYRVMAVFQGTEAVFKAPAHHVTVGVGPCFIGGAVLDEGHFAAIPYRHTTHHRAEIRQNVIRLTLGGNIRIKRHAGFRAAKSVRHRLIAVLRDGVQRPFIHIRPPRYACPARNGGGSVYPSCTTPGYSCTPV